MAEQFHAELVKDANIPNAWRVEKLDADGDGGVDIAIFAGPSARDRATEYAAWKYGKYEEALPRVAFAAKTPKIGAQA